MPPDGGSRPDGCRQPAACRNYPGRAGPARARHTLPGGLPSAHRRPPAGRTPRRSSTRTTCSSRARGRGDELGCRGVRPGVGRGAAGARGPGGARSVVEVGTGAGVSGPVPAAGHARRRGPDHHRRRGREPAGGPRGVRRGRRAPEPDPAHHRPRPRRAAAATDRAYDLVLLDAEPLEYDAYTDQALRLLRPRRRARRRPTRCGGTRSRTRRSATGRRRRCGSSASGCATTPGSCPPCCRWGTACCWRWCADRRCSGGRPAGPARRSRRGACSAAPSVCSTSSAPGCSSASASGHRMARCCGRSSSAAGCSSVADGVVVVERPHAPGSPAVLPADPAPTTRPPRGGTCSRPPGETVVDPDYVTTWDVLADLTRSTSGYSCSSQRSSSRAPKPVAPLGTSCSSRSDRAGPAMSRCAHAPAARELAQEQRGGDRAGAEPGRGHGLPDVGHRRSRSPAR